MVDYKFLDERPTCIRGVAEQIGRLVTVTEELEEDLRHHNIPRDIEDDVIVEWYRARSKAIQWAQIVCRRRDEARHDSLEWQPTSPYVHSATQLQLFPRFAESLQHLTTQIKAWADEIDLFDEPASATYVLVGGEPYSAWQKCREVVSGAQTTLMLVDPYVSRETLDLLLSAQSAVEINVLTMKEELPSDFPTDWAKWLHERSGNAECRTLSKADMPHDRFLFVDGSVYFSGASFKDVGGRLSVLAPLEQAGLVSAVTSELDAAWQKAMPL